MLNTARELCGAGKICAAHCRRLIGIVTDRLSAGGTVARHVKFSLLAVSLFGVSAYNLGNDISRLSDGDGVTEHNVAFTDKIKIVKTCSAYSRTCKAHRG